MAEVERDRSTLKSGKLRVLLSPRDEVSEQRLSEDTEAGPVTHGGGGSIWRMLHPQTGQKYVISLRHTNCSPEQDVRQATKQTLASRRGLNLHKVVPLATVEEQERAIG